VGDVEGGVEAGREVLVVGVVAGGAVVGRLVVTAGLVAVAGEDAGLELELVWPAVVGAVGVGPPPVELRQPESGPPLTVKGADCAVVPVLSRMVRSSEVPAVTFTIQDKELPV
jgi:hypothetical protein